jgi:hypothetical protein
MFKIPKVNVIESDEGFSVEVLGWTGLKYIQNGKTLFIDSEILKDPYDAVIGASSIKKWDSGELIDDKTKSIIVDNVLRAYAWRGLRVILA